MNGILNMLNLKLSGIDTRMKFSVDPFPGDNGFNQWHDALKGVARLSNGIPYEFRKTFWLRLADKHVEELRIDWDKTRRFAFNERSNPDDNKLGVQIVKDLHRTSSSGYLGADSEDDRAMLKRVLLAYARWNKTVGYCQGFNVLAALILEVMDKNEADALKVMIFLIDHILPNSYFANNLRALSVDMAVFRDLLKMRCPALSKHLLHLQTVSRDSSTGQVIYEPPLTNMFTMQWFLTLFATCLPKDTVLRVWDSVLLEGSEVLLRTALSIWEILAPRIMPVSTADEFYCIMGEVTQNMSEGCIETETLIQSIYAVSPFPYVALEELREKYTYNITPFTSSKESGGGSTAARHRESLTGGHKMLSFAKLMTLFQDGGDEELDEDDMRAALRAFSGQDVPCSATSSQQAAQGGKGPDALSTATPGALNLEPSPIQGNLNVALAERMTTDMKALKKQYGRLRERQAQTHVIIAKAAAKGGSDLAHTNRRQSRTRSPVLSGPPLSAVLSPGTGTVMNHLFLARDCSKPMNKNVVKNGETSTSHHTKPLPITSSNGVTPPHHHHHPNNHQGGAEQDKQEAVTEQPPPSDSSASLGKSSSTKNGKCRRSVTSEGSSDTTGSDVITADIQSGGSGSRPFNPFPVKRQTPNSRLMQGQKLGLYKT